MKYKLACILLVFLMVQNISVAQVMAPTTELKRPKLVIGVVVDQMRYDYLYRYWNGYASGGFKRLLREGFSFENTHYDYVPTYTAPGHACIYTGTTPADNGIISNDWFDRASGKTIYCVSDSTVQPVGTVANAGKMSPQRLLSTTITDELKFATNNQSKVIAVALKDRGAILPGGHTANAAYWHDPATNNWVSSSYYMDKLPEWVDKFNARKMPDSLTSKSWELLYNAEKYTQSNADDNKYEGPFKGEVSPVFPHHLEVIKNKDPELIRRTPMGNTYTLEFAKQAMISEKMGQHKDVDFMAVSLSSTDYVGHQFGINSMEIEDTYYRLDKDLASFLLFLDAHVGKGNYLLFLTADHGAAVNPQMNEDHGIPSGVFNETLQRDSLKKALFTRFGIEDLMLFSDAYGIFLNNRLIESKGISYSQVEDFCLSFVLGFKGVRCALSASMLQGNDYREGISRLVQRGYNRQRSADICIQLEPGWIDWSLNTGTSHGSPYAYDTHVPLLFFGWGVKKGTGFQPSSVCDIAPTIASFLRIQEPSGTVGHTLLPFLLK